MENVRPSSSEQHQPSYEKQLEFMKLSGEAALKTPKNWLRPIAATAINAVTHEFVMTATNHDPVDFCHAEETILEHTSDSQELSLFVTKEPCTYREVEGHVPCSEVIVKSERIKSVYILEKDPNDYINGKGIDYLLDSGIAVNVLNDADLIRIQEKEWVLREQLKMRGSWGDAYHSPKGGQKEIIKREILPVMIARHKESGGQMDHILDIGAADGELTRTLVLLGNGAVGRVTAIEPKLQATALDDVADMIASCDFEAWHMNNPHEKVDFILASHVAYYFEDPVEDIGKIASHLRPNGTLGIILADWRSGKSRLYNDANLQDLSKTIHTNEFPRQINGDVLALILRQEFDVTQPICVPMPVLFRSDEEAYDRLGFMFAESSLKESEVRQVICKNLYFQADGSVVWNRDCLYFTLRHRDNEV